MNVHCCSIVPVYTCLAEYSSGPSSICSGLPSDKNYQSIGFAFHLSRCLVTSTVEFRDELYANNLLPYFMNHASRWRHVLAELQHYTFGYRRNDTQPVFWDDECNTAAAFLENRRVRLDVMTELVLHLTPSLGAAFLDHRRDWLGVMTGLQRRPVTPSHDHVSSLQRRRRRVLAPLRLSCNIRRNMYF